VTTADRARYGQVAGAVVLVGVPTVPQSGLGSPAAGDRQSRTGTLRARLRLGELGGSRCLWRRQRVGAETAVTKF
jgi:hypothetical protein